MMAFQKVKIHSVYLLINQLLFEVTFLMRKENSDIYFCIIIMKVQVFVIVFY
jgi:hypothetical protein